MSYDLKEAIIGKYQEYAQHQLASYIRVTTELAFIEEYHADYLKPVELVKKRGELAIKKKEYEKMFPEGREQLPPEKQEILMELERNINERKETILTHKKLSVLKTDLEAQLKFIAEKRDERVQEILENESVKLLGKTE
jgi:hypothetical protein